MPGTVNGSNACRDFGFTSEIWTSPSPDVDHHGFALSDTSGFERRTRAEPERTRGIPTEMGTTRGESDQYNGNVGIRIEPEREIGWRDMFRFWRRKSEPVVPAQTDPTLEALDASADEAEQVLASYHKAPNPLMALVITLVNEQQSNRMLRPRSDDDTGTKSRS